MILTLAAVLAAQTTTLAPQPFTKAACEDRASRAAMLNGAGVEDTTAALDRRSKENQAKVDALLDRLQERAELSKEETGKIALGLLSAPGFEAAFKEGMGLVQAMFGDMQALSDDKDDRANCLVVVKMFSQMPAIEANAQKQWTIMEGAIRAEAKARGVSLDP